MVDTLAWAARTDPGYRMLQRARSAVTEAQKDDFYLAAAAQARRGVDTAAGFDPRQHVKRCSAAGISPLPPAGRAPTSCTSLPR